MIDRYSKLLQQYFNHAYQLELDKEDFRIIKKELRAHYRKTPDLPNYKECLQNITESRPEFVKELRKCHLEDFETMQ